MDEDDAKLWAARISWWALSTVDLAIVGKLVGGLFGSKSNHPLPWIILLIIVTAATVYSLLLYYRYKAQRKSGSTHKSREQLEVEALAAYGALQQQTAQKTAPPQDVNQKQSKPPQNFS